MAIRNDCERFEEDWKKAQQAVLEFRDFGTVVLAETNEAKKQVKYGKGKYAPKACAKLSGEHCLSISYIEDARTVARAYSIKQVKDYLKRTKKAGVVPCKSHLILLASVADVEERLKWEENLLANRWSVKKLQRQLQEVTGRQHKGRRSPDPPETKEDACREFEHFVDRILFLSDLYQLSITDPVRAQMLGCDYTFSPEIGHLLKKADNLLRLIASMLRGNGETGSTAA